MCTPLALASLVACADRTLGGGETGGTTTSTGTASTSSASTGPALPTTGGGTSEPPGTSTALPGSSGPDSGEDPGCSFICDDTPPNNDCVGTQQLDPECPDGFKCTLDGDFSRTQCLEVAPDPKGMYEPCTLMGDWLSGLDDCGVGLLCWGVNERGQGTCVGLCDGTPDNCVCADPKVVPTWCQDCAVGICIPGCDPLLQDCGPTEGCYAVNSDFACAPDASADEGQANDPCEYINTCDPGLLCADAAFVGAGCLPGSTGCCSPFCTFPDGPCPNPDQSCVQFFDPMNLPDPEAAEIGACGLAP